MDSNRSIETLDKVVLFDGICMFCNTSVDFVIQNEVGEDLFFTPLQSDVGKEILRAYEYPVDYTESILFLENGQLLTKSNAGLAIAKYLEFPFNWLRVFSIVPRFIRDAFYNVIARYRYKWFGKYDACMVPTPELRKRFLE